MIFKNKLMKLFHKESVGRYALIVWSKPATEWAVGGNYLKKIYHMRDGYMVDIENYNPIKEEELMRQKIPVIDLTAGQEVPADSVLIPKTDLALGTIQLYGRTRGPADE